MKGLDDDPLSIVANVADILTFIAAVLAFVYVRYNTVRNGHKEMTAILESVFATIEETRTMSMMTSEPEEDKAAEANIPQKLLADLYALEMEIIVEFMYAYGDKLSNRLRNLHSSSFQESATWDEVTRRFTATRDNWHQSQRNSSFWNSRSMTLASLFYSGNPWIPSSLWAILKYALTLGNTPTLLRWYRVRDKVLELTRRREILRSRLLLQQAALTNLRAKSHETLVQKLVNENSELRSQVEEMVSSTKEMIRSTAEVKSILLDRAHSANEPCS